MKLKRSGIFTKIALIVLLICAITVLTGIYAKIEAAQRNEDVLRAQAEAMTAQNEEKAYAIENSDSNEVIADVARERLGLVTEEEQVFRTN